ncbi:hypothetical protein [Flavobacterium crassostreae]|uniref:Uncharacterized protein n=1 Tax=Flavobacterium crassostreae TaxID=1763534 RepID=A0A1B9DKR3_9FLAO|nr:hypothetical protein [Flavobacterium crassostreae]OCB70229.1 hypothetical protein LPBF_12365 [Flavobacterium crassostreae]
MKVSFFFMLLCLSGFPEKTMAQTIAAPTTNNSLPKKTLQTTKKVKYYHVEERINLKFGGVITTYDVVDARLISQNDLGPNNQRIITVTYTDGSTAVYTELPPSNLAANDLNSSSNNTQYSPRASNNITTTGTTNEDSKVQTAKNANKIASTDTSNLPASILNAKSSPSSYYNQTFTKNPTDEDTNTKDANSLGTNKKRSTTIAAKEKTYFPTNIADRASDSNNTNYQTKTNTDDLEKDTDDQSEAIASLQEEAIATEIEKLLALPNKKRSLKEDEKILDDLIGSIIKISATSQNQTNGNQNNTTTKKVLYAYVNVMKTYEGVALKGYKSAYLFKKLGNDFYYNDQMEKAVKWYQALFDLEENLDTEFYYKYASALKAIGQNMKAQKIMDQLRP